MRRFAAVAVVAVTALSATPADASVKVRNRLTITQPDGTPVGFGPEIRVWCGPFEPGVPVRSFIEPSEVRIRGPGSTPRAMASRSSLSLAAPTLWTVVNPLISVVQAFSAA